MDKHDQISLSGKKKTIFSVTYRFVLTIVILPAILDRAGIFSGNLQLHTLYSFTTISNGYIMLVTLITVFITFSSAESIGLKISRLRTIGVMMILMTGLIYHFILLPQKIAENLNYQVFTYGNIVAHYIAPIGMFMDWLLFDRKGRINKWEPLIYTSVPVVYFIIASIYGYYGSTIPNKETSYVYFFMDWGKLGIAGVMKWVLLILICILCLAYLIYFIDYSLAKRKGTSA